jgi:probable F420-dependent oxidoreductase
VAAERTSTIRLGTAVAIALARNPMTVALQANDLQALSGGRFMLGLGSQIKPHITKRFSMPWSHPAPRMREFVEAVRAIWSSWETGETLNFRGDFYSHTLMTPMFDPGPHPHGTPPILLAGVGAKMTEVAGEVADGFVCHSFTTPAYLREQTLPALQRGAARAGRDLDDFVVSAPAFVVTGDTEDDRAAGLAAARQQIGFYGSTPAYRPVLEQHGWGDLQDELRALTLDGKWDQLGDAVSDEIVSAFAAIGTVEEALAEVRRRYEGIAQRVTLSLFNDIEPERLRAAAA